jgi:hypothetical protein
MALFLKTFTIFRRFLTAETVYADGSALFYYFPGTWTCAAEVLCMTHGHFLRAVKFPVYFLSSFILTFVKLYELQVQLFKIRDRKGMFQVLHIFFSFIHFSFFLFCDFIFLTLMFLYCAQIHYC